MTQFELALSKNISAKKILIDYYSTLKFSSVEEYEENQKTIKVLAFAPVTFFKDVANQMKVKLSDILEVFKNSAVVRFFSKIGWSFRKLLEILKNGYNAVKEFSQVVQKFVEETKIVRMTTDTLKKFDEWLEEHQMIKKFSGPIIGVSLFFIYFFMADSGNAKYDLDLSDAVNSLKGNYSLSDMFGGSEGVKLFSLFAAGAFLKITFPWPGTDLMKFAAAIIATLARKFRVRLKQKTDEDIIKELVY